MCGKNKIGDRRQKNAQGSPPRVREKQAYPIFAGQTVRITPACAGKTQALMVALKAYRDHPRVCGKNSELFRMFLVPEGSPPRVREKRKVVVTDTITCGITPACAGKTVSLPVPDNSMRDHPRVCGKNLENNGVATAWLGSPPRVREKQV